MNPVNKPPETWSMVVDVTFPIPGDITDWPSHIAEPLLEQIERQCKCRVGWEPRVTFSGCFRNYDVPYGAPGSHYLDVQVGEFPTDETVRGWEAGRVH